MRQGWIVRIIFYFRIMRYNYSHSTSYTKIRFFRCPPSICLIYYVAHFHVFFVLLALVLSPIYRFFLLCPVSRLACPDVCVKTAPSLSLTYSTCFRGEDMLLDSVVLFRNFHHGLILRWMCGVTRRDNIRNVHIRGTTRVVQASKKITEKRLKWYGHVRRMKEGHIVRIMLDVDIPGKRKERERERAFY